MKLPDLSRWRLVGVAALACATVVLPMAAFAATASPAAPTAATAAASTPRCGTAGLVVSPKTWEIWAWLRDQPACMYGSGCPATRIRIRYIEVVAAR